MSVCPFWKEGGGRARYILCIYRGGILVRDLPWNNIDIRVARAIFRHVYDNCIEAWYLVLSVTKQELYTWLGSQQGFILSINR